MPEIQHCSYIMVEDSADYFLDSKTFPACIFQLASGYYCTRVISVHM